MVQSYAVPKWKSVSEWSRTRVVSWLHSADRELGEVAANAIGKRAVGTERQDVLQFLNRRAAIPAAHIDLRQKELRLREVRGVQTLGGEQILLSLIELIQLEVVHPELGIGEGVLRPILHGALVERQRV